MLLVANTRQLFLWCRLSQYVIDPRLGRNGCGRQRVVARHHHRANAQSAQFGKALTYPRLDHVLEMDRPQQLALRAYQQRRTATLSDGVDFARQGGQYFVAGQAYEGQH